MNIIAGVGYLISGILLAVLGAYGMWAGQEAIEVTPVALVLFGIGYGFNGIAIALGD